MSDAIRHQFTTGLYPKKRAYHLVIDYVQHDPNDKCPLYELIIATKPIPAVITDDLDCEGAEMPPEEIDIFEKTFISEGSYSFSDQYLVENKPDNKRLFTYDITLNLAHSDYFLDFEMKNNFAVGYFRMALLVRDPTTDRFEKMAQSYWVDENSEDDIGTEALANQATKKGDNTFVTKLRYLEDVPVELLQNAEEVILRITIDRNQVTSALEQFKAYNPDKDDICYSFDLAIYAHEVGDDHTQDKLNNQLIRVDWKGKEQSKDRFDATGRLTAFVEFEKSLSQELRQALKSYQS
jgi:hypothetical protein